MNMASNNVLAHSGPISWIVAGPGERHARLADYFRARGRSVCTFDEALSLVVPDGAELRRHWRAGMPEHQRFLNARATALALMSAWRPHDVICVVYEPWSEVPLTDHLLDWLDEDSYLASMGLDFSHSCLLAMIDWRQEALRRGYAEQIPHLRNFLGADAGFYSHQET